MVGQEKKRSGQSSAFMLDTAHVVTGILIVLLAILAFLNPEDNMILFPVIFLLAAILNFLNGLDRVRKGRGQKKIKMSGFTLMTIGGALFILCIVSAVTIWWR